MSKQEFWTLNLIGAITALLLLFNVGFAQYNRHLDQKIQKSQAPLVTAPKLQRIAQSLILRLANESRSDAEIRDLLSKHKMEVRFNDQN